MLKNVWRQNLVLFLFAFLMSEVLTWTTLGFVVLGVILVFLNIRPSKIARNILALLVFVSYWVTYGKIIDPEIGLNFLTSIIVLKILEKESLRDHYMIFFGLLLLISAGSLFERTLTYVFFFSGSFILLLRDFYGSLGQKWQLKDLIKPLLWTLPLTFFLFFFVPRLLNPIPFEQGRLGPGEVGYTPEVNISQLESLEGNESPVFQALVGRELKQEELYWRANTLSYNDGWNWPVMVQDKPTGKFLLGSRQVGLEIEQNFRLFVKADYFFALDVPRVISYGKESFALGSQKTMTQRRWQGIQRYRVLSDPRVLISDTEVSSRYQQLGVSKTDRIWIQENFSGKNLSEVSQSVRNYFQKNKFSYSLAPGRSVNFREFMERKIGLCSHYASSLALILRAKGIPTRLVSGFMGGSFNRFASFYLITQNDAHVWVEAYADGNWKRLDPTEWIAPERVKLGGEAYMESVRGGLFAKNGFRLPAFVRDFKQWFDQWDFKFYQWLEEMDYHTQDAWFTRLKFKRQWLLTIIPLVLVTFILVYYLYLYFIGKDKSQSFEQELWQSFYQKMSKRGINLSKTSIIESQDLVSQLHNLEIQKIWDDLVEGSFSHGTFPSDLKRRINKL